MNRDFIITALRDWGAADPDRDLLSPGMGENVGLVAIAMFYFERHEVGYYKIARAIAIGCAPEVTPIVRVTSLPRSSIIRGDWIEATLARVGTFLTVPMPVREFLHDRVFRPPQIPRPPPPRVLDGTIPPIKIRKRKPRQPRGQVLDRRGRADVPLAFHATDADGNEVHAQATDRPKPIRADGLSMVLPDTFKDKADHRSRFQERVGGDFVGHAPDAWDRRHKRKPKRSKAGPKTAPESVIEQRGRAKEEAAEGGQATEELIVERRRQVEDELLTGAELLGDSGDTRGRRAADLLGFELDDL